MRVRVFGVTFGYLQPHPPRRVTGRGEGAEDGPEVLGAAFSQRSLRAVGDSDRRAVQVMDPEPAAPDVTQPGEVVLEEAGASDSRLGGRLDANVMPNPNVDVRTVRYDRDHLVRSASGGQSVEVGRGVHRQPVERV